MKILTFDDYKILESYGFGAGLGADYNGSVDMSLSSFPYERSRIHFQNAVNTILDFNKKLKVNGMFNHLNTVSEDVKLQSLKVLRIINRENIYNAHISFDIDNVNYWGVIENVLHNDPVFVSEIFRQNNFNKEWAIKVKGHIIKVFNEWLKPKKGKYRNLHDEQYIFHKNTGSFKEIDVGDVFQVSRIYDKEILIIFNNDEYIMRDDNYVYFNYRFEPYED